MQSITRHSTRSVASVVIPRAEFAKGEEAKNEARSMGSIVMEIVRKCTAKSLVDQDNRIL